MQPLGKTRTLRIESGRGPAAASDQSHWKSENRERVWELLLAAIPNSLASLPASNCCT